MGERTEFSLPQGKSDPNLLLSPFFVCLWIYLFVFLMVYFSFLHDASGQMFDGEAACQCFILLLFHCNVVRTV